MLVNKTISKGLIALHLVTGFMSVSVVRADDTSVTSAPTAEETLISTAYRIGGTVSDPTEVQKELTAAAQTYLSTAQPEGQQERFTEALMKMNLTSPTEARSLMQDLSTASSKVSQEHFSSSQEGIHQVSLELDQVFAQHPAVGAQFGGCGTMKTGYILSILGVVPFIAGIWMLTNPGYNEGTGAILTVAGLALSFGVGPYLAMGSDCADRD